MLRLLQSLGALALLGAPLSAAQAESVTKVGLPVGDGPDAYGIAVAQAVTVIAQYSRWPSSPKTIRTCVVSPADHAGRLTDAPLVDGRRLEVARLDAEQVSPQRCEIVYLGRLSMEDQRALTARLRGEAVLTITESDPACVSRSMFCLLFQADSLSFKLNIDAVSRSQVRVDPRVLRIGLEGTE